MPLLYFLLGVLISFTACSTPTTSPKEKEVEKPSITTTIDTTITKDTIAQPLPPVDSILPCTCKKKSYKTTPRTQLTFSAHTLKTNPQAIEEWADNPDLSTIKSLRLTGFDSIPTSFSIFTEVTKVVLVSNRNSAGLDYFPKLKELHFFGGPITLNRKEKWMKRLQILAAQKTVFESFPSFRAFPNLTIIDFAFSGFKDFPKDLEQLSCLQELHFNAYINGSKDHPLNLGQLDLSRFPCLRKVAFQSWQNALTGLPKGLLSAPLQRVVVQHINLLESEKLALKDVKNILANKMAE